MMEDAATSACLPPDLDAQLARRGVLPRDETGLRVMLEQYLDGYSLVRLTSAAARRWKCAYRFLYRDTYVDCQSAAEAYARVLVACMPRSAEDATP